MIRIVVFTALMFITGCVELDPNCDPDKVASLSE